MQAVVVERRGRKRKAGKRYPSGDLVKQQEVMAARLIAFRQPHRQEVPESKRHEQEAEWPFGRLFLRGIISEVEYRAGKLYGRDVQRYRSHYLADVPDPNPPSIAGFMQPVHGGGGPVDDATANKIKDSYNNAVEALFDAGQRAAKAVARMCVFGEGCPTGLQDHMIRGLQQLVTHYGLTPRNKRGTRVGK